MQSDKSQTTIPYRRVLPMADEIPDLRPWGYAPGGYVLLKGCPHCGGELSQVDKRASSCRSCAEAAREKYLILAAAPLICDGVCDVPEG